MHLKMALHTVLSQQGDRAIDQKTAVCHGPMIEGDSTHVPMPDLALYANVKIHVILLTFQGTCVPLYFVLLFC